MWLTFLKLGHICGVIWIVSIIAFIGYVFWASDKGGVDTALSLAILLTGILAFLLMILSYIIHALFKWKSKDKHAEKHPKQGKKSLRKRNGRLYALIGVLLFLLIYTNITGIFSQSTLNDKTESILKGEYVDPNSNSYPTVQPTRAYIDPNPIITCNINESCGGGTRQLRKNICDNSTCCQLGDSWYFYEDKNKCLEDQKAQAPTNNSQQSGGSANLVPVFLSYFGFTYYCPPQNVAAAQSINATMESKRDAWYQLSNQCAENFWNSDSCYLSCKDGPIDNYGECIKQCPSSSDACSWTNAEFNSLYNQIKDLCK